MHGETTKNALGRNCSFPSPPATPSLVLRALAAAAALLRSVARKLARAPPHPRPLLARGLRESARSGPGSSLPSLTSDQIQQRRFITGMAGTAAWIPSPATKVAVARAPRAPQPHHRLLHERGLHSRVFPNHSGASNSLSAQAAPSVVQAAPPSPSRLCYPRCPCRSRRFRPGRVGRPHRQGCSHKGRTGVCSGRAGHALLVRARGHGSQGRGKRACTCALDVAFPRKRGYRT
jgi:hypothetical protein